MKSTNHNREHGILHFYEGDKEIVIVHNGKCIASMHLETMPNPDTNKSTNNFWLVFNPKKSATSSVNAAEVWNGEDHEDD